MASWTKMAGCLLWAALIAAPAVPTASAGPPQNTVSKMGVRSAGQSTRITLYTRRTPTFTVFKLSKPDRLVVDLMGVEFAKLDLPRTVEDGRVSRIASASFKQAGRMVSRLIIGMEPGVKFDARVQKGNVVVMLSRSAGENTAPASRRASIPAPVPTARQATAKPAAKKPEVSAAVVDHRVVEKHGDRARARKVVIRNIGVDGQGRVVVDASGPIDAYQVLEVFKPFRLAIDIFKATMFRPVMDRRLAGGTIERIRAARHPDKVRVVMDCRDGRRIAYHVVRRARGLGVLLGKAAELLAGKKTVGKKSPSVTAGTTEPVSGQQGATAATAQASAGPGDCSGVVRDIDFRQEQQQARVIIAVDGEPQAHLVHNGSRSAVLEIEHCRLPLFLERTLDTSAFGGAVRSVSAYRVDDKVKLVVATSKTVSNRLERRQGKLQWVFDSPAPAGSPSLTPGKQPGEVAVRYQPDEVAGYSVRRPELSAAAGSGPSKRRKYRGKRITLDFKGADIHNILRLIADVAKLNIITSDEVKGKITITMRNVPWDQALDIILKTKKLGQVRQGNIIRVATLKELAEEQKLEREAAKARREVDPLRVRLIPVNFAVAADIEKQVKDILSERGSVSIDTRTNVLIVKDVLENLVKAEGLVRSLDTETPQVLIEARIVEANTQFVREVGIQWGGDMAYTQAAGNPTGLPFPNNMWVRGGADDPQTENTLSGIIPPGHYAINLPAAVGAGSGGALGFMLGSASGAEHLNLRLSALENQGAVKIISAPKITTLDNQKAKIGQGVSIPISVVSAAGVNTQFVEAKLELEVSPHITQQGSILLSIKVRKNEPDFSRTGARGDPTILKKEAETQVLVRDGDTTVIGGIYTRKTSETITGIPVLSQIPVLGWFFRNTKKNDDRTELLIFITPRIVNRLQATVSQR